MSVDKSVGAISLDMMLNYNSFQGQMKGIERKGSKLASSIFTKIGLVAAAAFSAKALFGFAKSAISLASDLHEVQNVVDNVFTNSAARIEEFAKTSVEMFGLSEFAAKSYTGYTGAMLKSLGLAETQVADMSIEVAKLAGDFAAFYNLDPEVAFEKIRAGISGITMPLRQLGYNMTEATLSAFALEQGMTKAYREMTEAEKAVLRLNYLLYSSKDAQGDFARTFDSWANQTRIFTLRWDDLKRSFGGGLMNMFTPVLKWINILIERLTTAGKYFTAFTNALFGFNKNASKVSGGGTAIAESFGEATENQDDYTESLKKATKQANKSLASFDKLNIVGSPADGGGAGAGIDSPFTDIMTPDFGSEGGKELGIIDERMQKLTESLKGFLSEIKLGFNNLFETHLRGPFEQLKDFATNLIFPRLKESLKLTFDNMLIIAEQYKTLFSNIVKDYFESFINALPGLLEQAGITFLGLMELWDEAVITITHIWTGFVDILIDLWDEWGRDTLDKAWEFLTKVWENFNLILYTWIIPVVRDALEWLREMWDKHLSEIVRDVLNFVAKLVNAALEIYNKFIDPIIKWLIVKLGPRVKEFFSFVRNLLESAITFIKEFVKGITKILGGIIDFLLGVFTGDWKRAFGGLKSIADGARIWINSFVNFVKNIFGNIIDLFRTNWAKARNQAIEALTPLLSWFRTLWSNIKSIFNSIPNYFRDKFIGAKNAIVSVFSSIGNLLKSPINGVIDIVNNMIRRINGINIRIPSILGGGFVGFNIASIPRLAEGGIVDSPTLAMVGDNKRSPEVIAPLHKLNDIIENALSSRNDDHMIEILNLILQTLKNLNLSTEVYIGDEKIEDVLAKRKQRQILRSGRVVEVRG